MTATHNCEAYGCDHKATVMHEYETVTGGHMCDGKFIVTSRGVGTVGLCDEHSTEARAAGVEEFVSRRCVQ